MTEWKSGEVRITNDGKQKHHSWTAAVTFESFNLPTHEPEHYTAHLMAYGEDEVEARRNLSAAIATLREELDATLEAQPSLDPVTLRKHLHEILVEHFRGKVFIEDASEGKFSATLHRPLSECKPDLAQLNQLQE